MTRKLTYVRTSANSTNPQDDLLGWQMFPSTLLITFARLTIHATAE
jgi:hypothetical protein